LDNAREHIKNLHETLYFNIYCKGNLNRSPCLIGIPRLRLD